MDIQPYDVQKLFPQWFEHFKINFSPQYFRGENNMTLIIENFEKSLCKIKMLSIFFHP